MSMYASDRISDFREGECIGDFVDIDYYSLTPEMKMNMEELSHRLEKEANEKAKKSAETKKDADDDK